MIPSYFVWQNSQLLSICYWSLFSLKNCNLIKLQLINWRLYDKIIDCKQDLLLEGGQKVISSRKCDIKFLTSKIFLNLRFYEILESHEDMWAVFNSITSSKVVRLGSFVCIRLITNNNFIVFDINHYVMCHI